MQIVHAKSKPSGSSNPNSDWLTNSVSIGIGFTANDMRYINNSAQFIFDYQMPMPVIIISTDHMFFNISYNKQNATKQDNMYIINMIFYGGAISYGPNIGLFKSFFGFPINAFVPVRFGTNYNYLVFNNFEIQPRIPELYLLNYEAGLGMGIKILPIRNTKYQIKASAISSIGSLLCIRKTQIDQGNISRSLNTNIEFNILRLANTGIGITIGYTYKMIRWTDEKVNDSKFIIRSITTPGDIPKRRGQSAVWLGINL